MRKLNTLSPHLTDFTEIQYGVRHLSSGEVFVKFESETEALLWLHNNADLPSQDCEIVQREVEWSAWHAVHPE